VLILTVLTLICKFAMDAYLATKSGYLLKATGDNPTVVASLAKDSGRVKILGLSIANALVSLAGCVMCQYQRYFDVSMGTGTLVLAVASVILGTQLLRGIRFLSVTSAVIVGSILYKACVALALNMGLSPFDLKLITALLLLVIMVLGGSQRKKVYHRD
jgi:putative ABC transport system permease protein